VIKHVKAGKQCTKLAMTFESKVSFVLTAKGEIRRIKPLDIIQEAAANNSADTEDDRFDGDMLLMIGELSKLIEAMTESLGGLVEQQASPDSAAE
jgi:recombination associated protein RdgC